MTATADAYRIFDVERRGDALIVTPVADPVGFPSNQLATELRHLRNEFDARRRNLVLDFGGMTYHGATMLTALDGLYADVRRRGGSVAVVGLSDDDLRVLNAYGLAGRWPIYEDAAAATAAVVHESIRERLWRKRRFLAALAAVLCAPLLTAAVAAAMTVHPHVAAVRDLEAVLADYRMLHWKTSGGHPVDIKALGVLQHRSRDVADRVREVKAPPPELRAAAEALSLLVHRTNATDGELADVQVCVAEARRAVDAQLAGETPPPTMPASAVASDAPPALPPTETSAATLVPASVEPAPPTAGQTAAPPGTQPSPVVPAHAESGPAHAESGPAHAEPNAAHAESVSARADAVPAAP